MNKLTVLFIITAATVTAACSRGVITDLDTYGLVRKPLEMTVVVEDGELDYTVFFNRFGQIDSLVRYGTDGEIHGRELYFYDRKHHRTRITAFDSDGMQEGWYEYEYDGNFISTCIMFGMNSEQLYKWEHVNDGVNIIESRCYMEGELQYTDCKDYNGLDYEERMLDPQGNETGSARVKQIAPDKPTSIKGNDTDITIEYDEHKLPVHCINVVISSNGEFGWHPELDSNPQRWYRYTFDSEGNWITRTEHSSPDGPSVNTVTRTILY